MDGRFMSTCKSCFSDWLHLHSGLVGHVKKVDILFIRNKESDAHYQLVETKCHQGLSGTCLVEKYVWWSTWELKLHSFLAVLRRHYYLNYLRSPYYFLDLDWTNHYFDWVLWRVYIFQLNSFIYNAPPLHLTRRTSSRNIFSCQSHRCSIKFCSH